MKKVLITLSLLLIGATASAGNWSLGAGGLFSENAYLATKATRMVVPFISYQQRYLVIYGPFAKLRYPIDDKQTVGLVFQFGFQDFEPKDSSNPQMRLLTARKRLVYLGPYYRYLTDFGDFFAGVAPDVTGRSHGGFIANFHYGIMLAKPNKKYFLRPTVGVQWTHRKINQHFYEVTPAEAITSGFSAYQPGHTLAPFANLFGSVQVYNALYWTNVINLSYLPKEITRSPMSSGRKMTYAFITGLTFELGQREQRFNH